jgi:protein involved in polysaccharide export with SLBB domain
MSNLTEQDTSYFLMENQIRLFSPGGSVDFTKLSDTSSSDSKYIVKDGDVIIIPRKENVIYVFGQVPHPGRVSYVKGKGYEYYINASGGYGEYADNDVMVIKGSSRNWIPADDSGATLEEGDYIYVPKDPKRSFHYYLAESAKYIGIIGSIATIILLLKTL